jgi:hypothetical protein
MAGSSGGVTTAVGGTAVAGTAAMVMVAVFAAVAVAVGVGDDWQDMSMKTITNNEALFKTVW